MGERSTFLKAFNSFFGSYSGLGIVIGLSARLDADLYLWGGLEESSKSCVRFSVGPECGCSSGWSRRLCYLREGRLRQRMDLE